jgi:hypothetical protein
MASPKTDLKRYEHAFPHPRVVDPKWRAGKSDASEDTARYFVSCNIMGRGLLRVEPLKY